MSVISSTKLRRLDFTLLLIFLGLMKHRKATAVASELGLTQSAISQALKRLRSIFDDALFIRRPHGLEPTAAAVLLEAPFSQAVEEMRSALESSQDFEPATAEGVLRLAALDAEQAALVPGLSARLSRQAPNLQLSVLPIPRDAIVESLMEGRIDIAMGYIRPVPDLIEAEILYREEFLICGAADLLREGRIDLNAFCAAPHILVSPGGDRRGIVDDTLERIERSREVVLSLPAFLPALAAAKEMRALVTMPSRVARAFAPTFGLTVARPPIDVSGFPVSVFWHRRDSRNPMTLWVRQQLRELLDLAPVVRDA